MRDQAAENDEILEFITRFRQGFDEEALIYAFTNGNCYHFAVILKNLFPDGEIVYDSFEGHFMYRRDSTYYDIAGKIDYDEINFKYVRALDEIEKIEPAFYEHLMDCCAYCLHR